MTPSDHPTEASVHAFYTALRAADVEAWLATFAATAVVLNPAGATPVAGHEALRELWTSLTGPFERLLVHEDYAVTVRCGAAVKWTAHGTAPSGEDVTAEGIDVFELDAHSRITRLSSYWDPSGLRSRLC